MTTTHATEITTTSISSEWRPVMTTRAERYAAGKALRSKVPRSSHAAWSAAPDRPDSVSSLEESNRSRRPELVPIRNGRMALSPFTFLRGSADVMANDLSHTPISGIRVQACGDAHLNNFGVYATPERDQVFDVNDFDETLPGPWEWDVKRLAASIQVAGRQNGFTAAENRQAVLTCVESYRQMMRQFASMRYLDIWYTKFNLEYMRKEARFKRGKAIVDTAIKQSQRRTSLQAFPKMVENVGGQFRIKDDPPLIVHYENRADLSPIRGFIESYLSSVPEYRRVLRERYHIVDVAQKVVGVGSVGTRCAIILCQGDSDLTDPLFLQVKEAGASVLEPFVGASSYANHGQRVVNGQQLTQGISDMFLGWGQFEGRDYYVRQLRDMKWTVTVEQLDPQTFAGYARACGMTLALGHARSGDPTQISGYLGNSDSFSQAITDFTETYADQTKRDHAALLAAIKEGRIQARSDI
jgi:uncharacterized protein (DUF2252 family)